MNAPQVLVGEIVQAQGEDPEFAVSLAKARAKARGENYDPARHGPFAPPVAPGTARRFLQEAESENEGAAKRAAEMLEEWANRQNQLPLMEGF